MLTITMAMASVPNVVVDIVLDNDDLLEGLLDESCDNMNDDTSESDDNGYGRYGLLQ